jgi:hypothetical protein
MNSLLLCWAFSEFPLILFQLPPALSVEKELAVYDPNKSENELCE